MKRFVTFATATACLVCMGIAPASAQSLKEKVMGAWTLDVGSEIFQDGKKVTPWAAGSLILDSTGICPFL
jgi:hypothetical protein